MSPFSSRGPSSERTLCSGKALPSSPSIPFAGSDRCQMEL